MYNNDIVHKKRIVAARLVEVDLVIIFINLKGHTIMHTFLASIVCCICFGNILGFSSTARSTIHKSVTILMPKTTTRANFPIYYKTRDHDADDAMEVVTVAINPQSSISTRKNFLQNAAVYLAGGGIATTMLASPDPAWSKEVTEKVEFENCVSGCVYDCTKPKGAEQKPRVQCIKECKPGCKPKK